MSNNLAIYVHWPFCKSKCPYCDFNSHVASKIDFNLWHKAYIKEIEHFKDYISGKNITSIFFGGGTPTLMPPFIADAIISKFSKIAKFDSNIEITLEGNPTSVELKKFNDFKTAGINRVSLGVQSLNNDNLKFLGREHSSSEALKAVEKAQIFDNYSFDLIYALPEQTLSQWEKELTEALTYAKGHLSLYQLTIEKGTKFYSDYRSGKFKMPENDLSADFYNLTGSIMEKNGLPAYEVSNYAKSGYESRHNMTYWRYGDYLGIGAGAHSRISLKGKTAIMMIHSPDSWLKSVQEKGNGIQTHELLSEDEINYETIMMGLRTKEGIKKDIITNNKQLALLINENLLEEKKGNIIATQSGFLVLNSLINSLVDN
ncbi:MAG: radical SAM family heme chaperone HemW [Rickettsiales bacterium]|nr:radical SAM family heme chaperone HemW [Pseudomonadota bacterium]MDA0966768.1 radical SAM family heme chaperone HemW [Pseudomonadota bacterium]MDG4543440.1 radical SAM family heme chaperone HemW [Rickettsiales bacterium]MDG4546166.1 radical SAM family heme chaperone HemW [Rickettsiales bacterium]MDG4547639.1 radical SAM family heme chaperone HemW [Rickettsiales bacterium]